MASGRKVDSRSVSKYIHEMEKKMTAQIMPQTFDSFDTIFVIVFKKNFELACGITGVNVFTAMLRFQFFIERTASDVLNALFRGERKCNSTLDQWDKMVFHHQLRQSIYELCAAVKCKKAQYGKKMAKKSFSCKDVFIEDSDSLIGHNMC